MAQATLQKETHAEIDTPSFRYRFNVYFQDGLVATALLAALLYLTLAASLEAAGHVADGMGIVVLVTLGAVSLGVLMSFSRFDGFFALSHALFTGLALILFLMARLPTDDQVAPFLDKNVPEVQARAYYVLLQWLNWLDAAISGSASADNYVFVFEIAFLLWWLAFLGMWSILRYGFVWRAVVPAALVMLINAYYAPQAVTTLLAVFSALALFLLIRTNLAHQQLRWRERHLFVAQELTWDFLRTGLTYTVIVLAIAWLLPGLGRNVQVRQLLAPINEQWEQTSQGLDRLYQGLNRRPEAASAAFGRSLTLGGARNVGDSLIFNVRTQSGRYWRAVTFDTYTGKGWVNSNTAQAALPAFQPAPIAAWAARAPLTQTISMMASTGNVVFGVPDIRQLDLPVDVVAADVPATPLEAPALGEELPGAVEFSMVRARETLDIGDAYTVLSSATVATELALQSAGTDYPAAILDRFVQMPEDFSPRVAALAQSLTLTATTPYEKAKAIEGYLRTIPYNDNIEAPPPNADPIEYFLFAIREGYCDYYATSMAMMLRSLGLPARTASGYAEGSFDEESGLYYVTERDAHTWVEMYYPGLGWVEFEPTAGESPLQRPSGDDTSATITRPPASPSDPTQGAGDEANRPEEGGNPFVPSDEESGDSLLPWWVWAILTPLLLVLGVALLWRLRVAGPTAFTADFPILLFERLQRWAARLGLAPEAHQTPYEQAQRWAQALPEGREPIAQITHSYVEHRFSGHPAPRPAPGNDGVNSESSAESSTESSAESRAWRVLEPVLWKAWGRRLLPGGRRRRVDPYTLQKDEG